MHFYQSVPKSHNTLLYTSVDKFNQFFLGAYKKIGLLGSDKIIKLFFFKAENKKLQQLQAVCTSAPGDCVSYTPGSSHPFREFGRNDVTCYYENPAASTRPWQAHNEEVTQLLF